jgi:hypothetical protein
MLSLFELAIFILRKPMQSGRRKTDWAFMALISAAVALLGVVVVVTWTSYSR